MPNLVRSVLIVVAYFAALLGLAAFSAGCSTVGPMMKDAAKGAAVAAGGWGIRTAACLVRCLVGTPEPAKAADASPEAPADGGAP